MSTRRHTKRIPAVLAGILILGMSAAAYAEPVPNVDNAGAASKRLDKTINSTQRIFTRQETNINTAIENDDHKRPSQDGLAGTTVELKGVKFSGDVLFADSRLQAAISNYLNNKYDINGLGKIANSVSAYYRANGYPVAKAYLPEQEIKDGVVDITVKAGRFGQVKWRLNTPVSRWLLKREIVSLSEGTIVTQQALEQAILLLNDIPGIAVNLVLLPGGAADTVDMEIKVNKKVKTFHTIISTDNYGSTLSGRNDYSVDFIQEGLNCAGQSLHVTGVTTGGQGSLFTGNLSYSLPAGRSAGSYLSAGYSQLYYTVGQPYKSWGIYGKSNVWNLDWTMPLTRSREKNSNFKIEYNYKKLSDDYSEFENYESSGRVNSITLSIEGNLYDKAFGGARNAYRYWITAGKVDLFGRSAGTDISTTNCQGNYVTAAMEYTRDQYINPALSLYINLNGQLASRNLYSSEKMQLSGPYAVRAFLSNDYTVDQGLVVTGEFRYNLSRANPKGDQWIAAAFYDYGTGMLNKHAWSGYGDSRYISLQGAGLGLMWQNSNRDWYVRLDRAWKFNTAQSASNPNQSGTWLIKVAKKF